MTWADWLLRGFAIFGIVVFTWTVTKNGIAWVATQAGGALNVAKTDFQALEARVASIEKVISPMPVPTVTTGTSK